VYTVNEGERPPGTIPASILINQQRNNGRARCEAGINRLALNLANKRPPGFGILYLDLALVAAYIKNHDRPGLLLVMLIGSLVSIIKYKAAL
jgi:hypothetical protein